MRIRVNEREAEIPEGATAGEAAAAFKPGADLLIVNGFPAGPETPLAEGDRLVLIRRGEVPSPEEMESLLTARHTPGVHEKVRGARVGIAGLGGLGSHAALALARVGVGELVLADFDVVEPSNLNRQCYFVRQIGRTKTEALAETIREANPHVRLRLHPVRIVPSNVAELFAGCSVLVEAFDTAEEKAMLVETALAVLDETVVVAASGLAGYGPGQDLGVRRLGPRFFVVGDLVSEARPFRGLMAPRVGVAAHLQANLALRILLDEE
jgi:sulfur carrier protein ThiS adenylyltransferase